MLLLINCKFPVKVYLGLWEVELVRHFWSEKTDLRFLVLCSNVETLESWNTMVFKALPRTVFYSQRMRMLVVNFMVNPLDCYWHHLLNCIRENRWRFITGQQCRSGRHFTWASVASEPLQDHKGNQNRLFSSGVFLRSGWYDILFHTDRKSIAALKWKTIYTWTYAADRKK